MSRCWSQSQILKESREENGKNNINTKWFCSYSGGMRKRGEKNPGNNQGSFRYRRGVGREDGREPWATDGSLIQGGRTILGQGNVGQEPDAKKPETVGGELGQKKV